MNKTLSLVLTCILSAIIIVAGVFAFLPDGIEFGNYNIYHSPISLIQKGNDIGKQVKGSYQVNELPENVSLENSNVTKIISKRLASIYSYYGAKFAVEGNKLEVTIPATSNENNTSVESVLSSVICQGKVEILSEDHYEADHILLSAEHFASANTAKYVSDDHVYYIVNLKLNQAGKEIAAKNLKESTNNWSAYCAVDEAVTYGVAYVRDYLQIYTNSDVQGSALVSYVNYGALDGKLAETASVAEVEGSGKLGTILEIVFFALLVAGWVYFIVCFGKFGLVNVISSALSCVVFVWFAGTLTFNYFNVFAFVGAVISLGMLDYLTYVALSAIKTSVESGKKLAPAVKGAFSDSLIFSLIVCGAGIVLGVICWFIPTGVTAPLGNALVYGATLALASAIGINRLFANVFAD